jgi:hypothetical protein
VVSSSTIDEKERRNSISVVRLRTTRHVRKALPSGIT